MLCLIAWLLPSKCKQRNTSVYPLITQYGSTAYLGMTRVVSSQSPRIENIRHGATAKCNRKEPKQCHNSTKDELGYTLLPTMHA